MTPYEIDILLWYYARCEDHPDLERNPPVWRPTIAEFMDRGLLSTPHTERCYELTPRGKAYVDALQRVPLPEQVWVTTYPTPEGDRS